jgi:hypothetical protein
MKNGQIIYAGAFNLTILNNETLKIEQKISLTED